jgi:hypothetical protein
MRAGILTSNASWVCFECRIAERRPPSYAGTVVVPCRTCRQPSCCIGKRLRVPQRRDTRRWRQLRDLFVRWTLDANLARAKCDARQRGREARIAARA